MRSHAITPQSGVFCLNLVLQSPLNLDGACRIVICGGGIIGAATAYYLARRGQRCTIVDRAGVAAAASGRAGGFLAKDWCDSSAVGPLARLSYKLHAGLAEELQRETDYRRAHGNAACVAALLSQCQKNATMSVTASQCLTLRVHYAARIVAATCVLQHSFYEPVQGDFARCWPLPPPWASSCQRAQQSPTLARSARLRVHLLALSTLVPCTHQSCTNLYLPVMYAPTHTHTPTHPPTHPPACTHPPTPTHPPTHTPTHTPTHPPTHPRTHTHTHTHTHTRGSVQGDGHVLSASAAQGRRAALPPWPQGPARLGRWPHRQRVGALHLLKPVSTSRPVMDQQSSSPAVQFVRAQQCSLIVPSSAVGSSTCRCASSCCLRHSGLIAAAAVFARPVR